jgi:hypothetical protein
LFKLPNRLPPCCVVGFKLPNNPPLCCGCDVAVVDPNRPPPVWGVGAVFELAPKGPPEDCAGCGALSRPCDCGADVVVDEPKSPPVPGVRDIDAPPNNEAEVDGWLALLDPLVTVLTWQDWPSWLSILVAHEWGAIILFNSADGACKELTKVNSQCPY